jgi:hypothetical protein
MKTIQEIRKDNFFLRHINGLVIIVAFLISIYILWIFAKPAFLQATGDLSSKINDLEKRKGAITKTISNLKAKDYETEKIRLEPVDKFFPSENDALLRLSYIENEAKNNNLNTSSLKTDSIQANEKSQFYTIQGSFEGSLENILNFFKSLGNSERAIGIKDVSFNPQDEDGKKVSIGITFAFPQIVVSSESTVDKAVTTFTPDEEKIIENLTNRKPSPSSTASTTFGKQNPFTKF